MKLNQFAVYRVDQQTAGKALWHRIKGFKKAFTSYKDPRIERFSLVGSYALPNR